MSVREALIIAAGNGCRLNGLSKGLPKPLVSVGGTPILARILRNLERCGICDCKIVVGYQKDQIREFADEFPTSMTIELIENDNYELANGFSVLAARNALSCRFLLLMGDHLMQRKTLCGIASLDPNSQNCYLAVDSGMAAHIDRREATKVQIADGRINQIGKNIDTFNALDTGLFSCNESIFDALQAVCERGKGTLAEAMQLLASDGKLRSFDIAGNWWIDIDTEQDLHRAQKLLTQDES